MKQFILMLLIVGAGFSGVAHAQDDHNDGIQKSNPGPGDVAPEPTPVPEAAPAPSDS